MTDGATGRRRRTKGCRAVMQKEARHRESARLVARHKEAEVTELPHGAASLAASGHGEPGENVR